MMSAEQSELTKDSEEMLLHVENLIKYFDAEQGILDRLLGDERQVHAVDGVSLSLNSQETLGIVGESGCGKSTLGLTLARLYKPTKGTIHFEGDNITDISGKQLKQLRKHIQVIFQDPLSSLNPRKTAGEIVKKPLEVHDIVTGQAKDRRVNELFEEVGLDPKYTDRYPHEFSGGQRQRIGIARALAVEPKLIIADEPVSALDVSVQAQIINLMQRLQDKYELAYLFIAHDLSVVKHVSDRIGVMYLGEIIEEGFTKDIFGNPQHPYTRSLLNAIPRVEEEVEGRKVVLEGNPPSPIDPPTGCRFHTRCPEYIGNECRETKPQLVSVSESKGITQPSIGIETDTGIENSDEHRVACHWMDKSPDERRKQEPY